ncbi:hypothetical protein GCM10011410_21120 [Hoyosella rhizosphaerae]|uniref:Uncharacterized protein n=1 Tax=Hoyosella rhizosphaerae TaxID=1755582 RepID=A0A916UC22_9ACTN|nr:hypothetical protein GCM10011410_21120 [Hoyosella rhizosphaerae]
MLTRVFPEFGREASPCRAIKAHSRRETRVATPLWLTDTPAINGDSRTWVCDTSGKHPFWDEEPQ